MDTQELTLTLLIYRSSLETEIMEDLEELKITHYTKWTEVKGVGAHSEPHLDSHIWPGTNNVIAVMSDPKTEERIYTIVRKVKEHAPLEGIKAFTLPLLRHS